MGRIVGRAWYLFFICIPFFAFAQSSLRVVDEEGDPLKKVQAGRPFMIQLELSGGGSLDNTPMIEGLDQFAVQDSSWSHTIINGDVTITYRYSVIASNPGTYTVGPASFSRNNVQEVSNALQLQVGTEQVGDSDQDALVLVRLSVDKDRVVKGERVVATLRYYYTDPSTKLRNFIEQQTEDITRKKARGPWSGIERINDTEYNYVELDWDMYPQTTGSITVPAFAAEYEVKTKQDPLFGSISRLLGMAAAQKRAYSNAVTLQVDDIPHSDKPLQGVGIIDSFEISADPSVVKQGEGSIVTLTVKGDFDPDQITIAELQNVPSELRHYESQESSDEPSSAQSPAVKRFEYIVQGLNTGSWEIPAQQFHYYDVATHAHCTLTTAPLSMTIMPGAPIAQPPATQDSIQKKKNKSLPIAQYGLYPVRSPFVMPWWLFFVLLVIPFFAWVFLSGRQSISLRREKTYRARRSYRALSMATSQLQNLKKEKNAERLYTLFIELFADKWQVPIGSITMEYVAQRLQDIGMPDDERAQWDAFFAAIAQQAFSAQQTEQHINDLFRQAEQWLERLKQLL